MAWNKITLWLSSLAVNPSDISYDKEEETVTISFPSPLPLGSGQLFVDFTGELNDKMKGFYRSKYTGSDGKEKYCAVTQFEVSAHYNYYLASAYIRPGHSLYSCAIIINYNACKSVRKAAV